MNMEVRFGLKKVLECLFKEFLGTTTIFKKAGLNSLRQKRYWISVKIRFLMIDSTKRGQNWSFWCKGRSNHQYQEVFDRGLRSGLSMSFILLLLLLHAFCQILILDKKTGKSYLG